LRFVVDRALAGRRGEIKEIVIAVEALGRSPSFDPKTDPIVRVEARRLRDRLNSYYENEGKAEHVVIGLPKGGYVPEFAERQTPPQPVAMAKHRIALFAGWALFGVTAAILIWLSPRKGQDSSATLRLSILPPGNASFESFAISPDGRKLAFTAARNGTILLWVRALDSLDAKPFAGTENASYPFWSPDSRSIAFFAIHKLKTIDIAGGPARDIADVVVGRGGAWSTNGIIAFCPRPIGALYQVAATGGVPKPLTTLDPAHAEVAHGFPQFLPDGVHFLYLAASSRPGESSIRAGSLGSTTSKIVLSSDTPAAYAPVFPGHPRSLLFVHDGALIAQPFDPERLELRSERSVIVSEVRSRRWRQAGFSISGNGVLLYENGRAEDQQLTWFDRQGHVLGEIGPRNKYMALALSPDDRHVAVLRDDDPATMFQTIWLMDLSREAATARFTDTAVAQPEFAPVWSPDGDTILFSRGDDRRMRLMVQALNGGPAKPILDTEGPKFPTDWSFDGRFITYGSQWPDYQYVHVWTMPLSGSAEPAKPYAFLQHSYTDSNACFSPADAGKPPRWIAYVSSETGQPEIYVREFPAGVRRWQVSTRGGGFPHWRSDGRELFYLGPDGTFMAVPMKTGTKFEFGAPQALFHVGLKVDPAYSVMTQYGVTRDGQRFLFNRRIPETAPRTITAVIPW
jgi:Tol biopolymer transport system component